MYFEGKGLEEVFRSSAEYLLNNGYVSSPRGKEVTELLNVSLCIKNPRKRLAYFSGRERGFNLCHAIVESLMLVLCENDLRYFSKFNENMKQFSDDGKTLHGCYGMRIGDWISYVINKLRGDKDSRQAVLSIYSIEKDSVVTKDVPCTETLQFLIRDDKLHMIVNMRSNDIIWGLPYDVFMFTSLQEVIANTLGVELGEYYHNVGSYHVYKEFYEVLDCMLNNSSKSIECFGLKDVTYSRFKKMSEKYDCLVSGLEGFDIEENEGYLKILVKEKIYRELKDKQAQFNGLCSDYWVYDFTKRWYK